MLESLVVRYSDDQSLHIVTKESVKGAVINWKKNRPVDESRVRSLKAYHSKTNSKWVDGIVYAWDNGEKLQIYDGWTRFTSAEDDFQMLFCVYKTTTEQKIIDHFFGLNSAVPVPSLYIDNNSSTALIEVVEAFCKRYPAFLSSSRRPHVPNFNRDMLTEALSNLDFGELSVDDILECLDTANKEVSKLKVTFPDKAKTGNLFLFGNRKVIWQEYVTEAIEQKTKPKSWFRAFYT